ncbi:MAG TPA: hypothetical protein VKW04_23690, partial [Planctomycetota bacterium]|nr:hypothetical protein [Planctomycetota bacterium]
ASAAAAQVTVSGAVQYEDRTYDAAGFNGTTMRPVRQADVELLDTGTSVALGSTDETGSFSFSGVAASSSLQVRIYARRAGGKINAVVRNNAGASAIYTALSASIDTSVTTSFGTIDLLQTGAGPAFNIFDCAVKCFQYLASLQPSLPAVPPPMTVYWELNNANGTYFDNAANGIFLLGLVSDPDQYDDDIILHEMGHWVAFNFSRDDTLGGPHSVIDQLDPRTSWSEGWAHYWSAAVRRFFPAEYANPNLQVDNFGSGNSVFDIEAPSFPTLAVMATNELAVATVLWHLIDGNTLSPLGSGSVYEPEIWSSVSVQIPLQINITLEKFHSGLTVVDPAIMPTVSGSETTPGIFKEREIRYYPDDSDPNESTGTAAPLTLGPVGLVQRTFFTPGDDWYSVAATPGLLSVQTLNLGDGGDTVLELYDASGLTLLASNDHRSSTDRSSFVETPVAANATFLVRVTRGGTVVQYGYYDLQAQVGPLPPPIPPHGAHHCGALGMDAVALLGLVRLLRRPRC